MKAGAKNIPIRRISHSNGIGLKIVTYTIVIEEMECLGTSFILRQGDNLYSMTFN